MNGFRLDRFLELLTSPTLVWGTVAGGFAILAIALIVLMMTRVGQTHPLGKSAILSVFTHVLLAFWMSSVQFAAVTYGSPEGQVEIGIAGPIEPSGAEAATVAARTARPWDHFTTEPTEPITTAVQSPAPRPQFDLPPDPKRQTISEFAQLLGDAKAVDLPGASASAPAAPARIAPVEAAPATVAAAGAAAIEAPAAQHQTAPEVQVQPPAQPARMTGEPAAGAVAGGPGGGGSGTASALLNQPLTVPRLDDPMLTPVPATFPVAEASTASAGRPAPRSELPGSGGTPSGPLSASASGEGSTGRAPSAGIGGLLQRDSAADSGGDALLSAQPEITPQITAMRRTNIDHEIPGIYKLRVAPDRAKLAQQQGGTQETEAAVNAALNWLAAHQSPDGRWDASQYGSGREDKVLGHDRQGAGAKADTGISGLALLAFLGAGHTHRDGQYQDTVARGLDFLIHAQASDGNLGGGAELYAAMYCHGMAAIALSEAYALTRDERLERPLKRAISFTLAAQHPTAGGWRYRAGDRQGDTSQLGWQLMALRSAKLAGIAVPRQSEEGMIRFLRSVEAGRHGGMAAYRAGERPNRTMTAEAMVCRHFLGLPADEPEAAREAGDFILEELPGQGKANLYYWYYATMAMHQLQGEYWQVWNKSLRKALVETQRIEGHDAGSWDTNTVWGGYGGRVYTTAMGALCLEVYYRFLPLYDPRVADRP